MEKEEGRLSARDVVPWMITHSPPNFPFGRRRMVRRHVIVFVQ